MNRNIKEFGCLVVFIIFIVSILGCWRFFSWYQCYYYTGESHACKVMVLSGGSFIFGGKDE